MITGGITQGAITDEALARERDRMGNIFHPHQYNTEATRDTIRHFVDGIGDDNPLWRDETYARKTRYGRIIAPPLFIYSVAWAGAARGLPGVHGFYSGSDFEFLRPIYLGDSITCEARAGELVEKPSKYAGRAVIQYTYVIYRNQSGEVIAKTREWTIRAERDAAKKRGKYAGITRYKYTPKELKAIEDAYDGEEIRGANPRFWEDVNEGDELTPVAKGPLNLSDMHAFIAGAVGGAAAGRGGAHKFGLQYRRRHTSWAYMNEEGVLDTPETVHAAGEVASEIGIPLAYDYGRQRVCWLGHLLTNWMGDDGFLKKLYVELRRFNMLGDTTWCKGRIARKYIENGERLVDIECWGENQRREITMPGHATIILPHKSLSEL